MQSPDADTDPMVLVGAWLQAAREADEPLPEAMTVATATADGWPSARMVMLRGLDRGLVFFTDVNSDKGVELSANPRAALLLHWLTPAHRQVSVVGEAEQVTREEADEYWRSRPPPARRSAAASRQSEVIASRAVLDRRVDELARRYPEGVELPRPSRWGGFRVIPTSIEFWQEASDGLHDRHRYRRAACGWIAERRSP